MRSRASAPPTTPKPSASGSRPPTPRPEPSAPPPHPAPPATTTPGRRRTRAREGQGTPRGTQGRGHGGAPSEGRHSKGQDAGNDTTWGQETTQEPGRGGTGDQGTEEKGTTANATTHIQEEHTTTGGTSTAPAPPSAPRLPGATPQHTPPKQASDAVRITSAHTHQPPETTPGMEGTPTRGERATPTEEAAGNAAARRTTTPSPPGDNPGRHKGHLSGTGRGRRHGHSDQDWGSKPPEDTGPRHRPPGMATPRTVARSTYPTHQPERHAQAPTARTPQCVFGGGV